MGYTRNYEVPVYCGKNYGGYICPECQAKHTIEKIKLSGFTEKDLK